MFIYLLINVSISETIRVRTQFYIAENKRAQPGKPKLGYNLLIHHCNNHRGICINVKEKATY